jgi:RND family efflux transporter MFP subunit
MNKSLIRIAAYAAVLFAAVGAVWFSTRGPSETAAAVTTGVHNHGAAGATNAQGTVTLSDADARRIGVTYATATLGSIGKEVRTVGQVTFDEARLRTITSKVDGWVESLVVDQTGQRVIEGQPVLTLYSPMLVSAQEELVLARRLAEDVGGGSAETRQRAAELLASTRRRLAAWDVDSADVAAVERTGIVRRSMTLRASASGFVTEKNVFAGQRIMAGDPLYKVADLSTVWVEGEVFEQDLAMVALGQAAVADFDALPGTHRTGRISYIYPTINPDTRTVRVRVVLGNGDLRLKPGMYATLRVTGTPGRAVVTIPQSAVLATGERSIVFVRDKSNQLVPREVLIGASSDDRVEVLRGLAAGETVVASATFLVDAESSLGTSLGGMGNMPGMEMTTPPKPLEPPGRE